MRARIVLALVLLGAQPADAETVNVPCGSQALVDAVAIANANAEEDDLWLAPGCLYAPPATLVIAAGPPVNVYGRGASVSGSDTHPVFSVSIGATLHLQAATVTRGFNSEQAGGGIRNQGTLVLSDCTVHDNAAVAGGGIYSNGTLRITRSTVSGNSASYGGGVYSSLGHLTLVDSTVSGNTAEYGGGISNEFGSAAFVNSTLFRNSARLGGGIYTGSLLITTLSHVTISGNSATDGGGGVYNSAELVLDNTIIANSTGPDCTNGLGTVTSSVVNLIEDGSCSVPAAFTGDPLLGKPTGSPAYLPLRKKSPAIGTAVGTSCPTVDQRGALRQVGSLACDLGAVEWTKGKTKK